MRIFVSHAFVENSAALAMKHALRRAGIHAWLDVDGVRISEAHQPRILRALDDSTALVFLLSHCSVYRPWVQAELYEAQLRRLPIVVVRLTPVGIPPWVAYSHVIERHGRPDEADQELAAHLRRIARRAGRVREV